MDRVLSSVIVNPFVRLPRVMFSPLFRHTVIVGLVSPDNGLAVIQPTRDPSGEVWILPQGSIGHKMSPVAAGHNVVSTEIPSLKRIHPHNVRIVDWGSATYAGSAMNPHARSGQSKCAHVILFRTMPKKAVKLCGNGRDCLAAQWVYSNAMLESLLRPTMQTNPTKATIVMAAAWSAKELGWLT